MKFLLYIVFGFFALIYLKAATPAKDRAIVVSVKASDVPAPSISLKWQSDSNAINYFVRKKIKSDTEWTVLDTLLPTDTSYTDNNITYGTGYEYYIEKWTKDYDGYGYIYAGIGLPSAEYRGKVVVLIDSTIAEPLSFEISRYISDLEGEGWIVLPRLVPRAESFNSEAILKTKNIILQEFLKDSFNLKTLVLLGRIPVPYSGAFSIDGHSNDHSGAWPTDVFYGITDGTWTDKDVNADSSARLENINTPGDGKFDQNFIPSQASLQTGRIDMFNLPEFPESEIDLLRRYLDKNHAYRNKLINIRNRGLIDDGFGMYSSEAFSATAWMNLPALLSPDSVDEGSFRFDLPSKDYLWAYGCNSGAYTAIHNTAYTEELKNTPYNAVFTMLFGSYNGDFDSKNNVLRAALASNPSILTCSWTGRPFWFFHHMALGETIGYSALLTQNNKTQYMTTGFLGARGIHIALLGDPTLTMHVLSPPTTLKIKGTIDANYIRKAVLAWNHSKDEILGYNIYRAEFPGQMFVRINDQPVKDSVFTDEHPFLLSNYYKVRAVRLEQAATGTYFNLSGSAKGRINFNKDTNNIYLRIMPNPVNEIAYIYLDLPEAMDVSAEIFNSNGSHVRSLRFGEISSGVNRLHWDLTDRFGALVSQGVYFLRLKIGKNEYTQKLVIIR